MRFDPVILGTIPIALIGAWASTRFADQPAAKWIYILDVALTGALWMWVVYRQRMGLIEASVSWAVLYEGSYTLGFLLLGCRTTWMAGVGAVLGLISLVLMTLGGEE